MRKHRKTNTVKQVITSLLVMAVIIGIYAVPCLADGKGDVAGAVESTWNDAKNQIMTVTNNVIFPALDMILAILFFVKVGTARIPPQFRPDQTHPLPFVNNGPATYPFT